MNVLPRIPSATPGSFSNASINFHQFLPTVPNTVTESARSSETSAQSLLQIHQLRMALSGIKPGQLLRRSSVIPALSASAISTSSLNLSTGLGTQIRSTEEINTAPTSFQHNGPAWIGQSVTAPWSGLGSTADVTVGGTYDGSDGQGTFTFEVNRAGTHGEDDLRLRVFAPDGSTAQNVNIFGSDPLNQVYTLSNGLAITLGAGDLVRNDTFEVDTSILSTSYTPNDPGWTGSTAMPSIGGSYDGSDGSGDLTFRVLRGGTHGEDNLRVRAYAPDGSTIQTINIDANDPIGTIYNLSNGLNFTLGEGELIRDETFAVTVDSTEPTNYTTNPEWIFSTVTPTIAGTYDGSNGSGSLRFRALDSGVHGQDDLRVRVYEPDGSTLETIFIDANDPIDEGYVLSNGLTVTFSAGDLIRNENFYIDVDAATNFSTAPNPIESTAAPALSGVYDGSSGTDTLTFLVTEEGTHGVDDLAFDVLASDGSLLDTINIGAGDPLNQSYALSNGLDFTLGAGSLALNETFTLDVNHLVPTSVNPNLSFDGTGINDPKLEDQFTITDGSFEINGNSIAVFENDSINSVLNRINNAGIDVSATFDMATETIVMTRDTPGSEHNIVLDNDTSGFLAATKLSAAESEIPVGNETSRLVDLEIMSGVSSGTLTINGTNVSFDVAVDSLEDVLTRIEVLIPNLDVDFDSETNRVSLSAIDTSDLSISSGGTGFFEALQIDQGLYEYVAAKNKGVQREGYSYAARRATARAINDFSRRFNAVFTDKYGEAADPMLQEIRADLKAAVTEIFGPEEPLETGLGIGFDFSSGSEEVFQFSGSVQHRFESSLKSYEGANDFQQLFFGGNSAEPGLADRLLDIVKRAESDLSLELGSTGSFIDIWA